MDNRQELMTAVRREVPSRIPYTYDALPQTDAAVKTYLGLSEKDSVADFYQCNHFDSIWNAIGWFRLPEREKQFASTDPNVHIDLWGCRREMIRAGNATYFEITKSPLADCETVAEIEAYDWPKIEDVVWPEMPPDFDLAAWKKDKVVSDGCFICPFGVPWAMRGMERLLMDLVLNPAIVEAIVAKVEEYTLACLQTALEKYPGAFDLISCGDDYGTQNGLFLSRTMIDHFFMPSLKRSYELGRKHGVMGYHHCCGAIYDIIPSFIDAGVQVLNPIQTSAAGMDPARLKREFGRDLAFHGSIDIQGTIVTGTPADVRSEVRSRIDTLGPNGFILAPSHVLQPDSPPENIAAMYEEVRSYGAKMTSGR